MLGGLIGSTTDSPLYAESGKLLGNNQTANTEQDLYLGLSFSQSVTPNVIWNMVIIQQVVK